MDADALDRAPDDHTQLSSGADSVTVPVLDDAHLLTRGRTSDVYLLDDTHVVRHLRDPQDSFRNLDLVKHLNAHEFPTARYVRADGPDLVMERLDGVTLLQALDVQDVSITEGVRILLDLHDALRAVPVPPPGVAPLVIGGGESIVHLDLHPANILMSSRGPQVIDWEVAGIGPAGLDLATTALVFAEIIADGNEYARPAHAMLRVFTDLAGPGFRDHVAHAATHRTAVTTSDPEEHALIPLAQSIVEQEIARR